MQTLDLADIKQAFHGDEWCEFTAVSTVENSDNNIELSIVIQDDLSWFAGHFPNQAVLPGVVQTNWACELAQFVFAVSGLKKVGNLKFKTMVLPNTQLSLSLRFNAEKHSVAFSYHNDEDTFSTGLMVFSG